MTTRTEIESVAKIVLERFPIVSFAFLFGSAAAERLRSDSDIDVAVYIDADGQLEIEEDHAVDQETDIQMALERVTDRNVDLLILNRAPATVCAAALLTGRPLLIREGGIYTRYFLAVTSVAIEFLQTEREFREIRGRSHSLSDFDRSRIERILDYVAEELTDAPKFANVTLNQYRTNRDLRRNLDRWVEMLINAAIDIGKIVLSSEQRTVPQTYGQILSELGTKSEFAALSGLLEPLAGLRNLLAHEYLDIRFKRIRGFVDGGVDAVARLNNLAARWVRSQKVE